LGWESVWLIQQKSSSILRQSTGYQAVHPFFARFRTGLAGSNCDQTCSCILLCLILKDNLPWASAWPIQQRSPSIPKQSTGFQAVHSFFARFSTGLAPPDRDQTCSNTLLGLIATCNSPWADPEKKSIHFEAVHRFSSSSLLLCKFQHWASGLEMESNMP
jgi:hypothetical protein